MNKKKFEFLYRKSDAFESFYILRRFKKRKKKFASSFDVFNNKNNKFFSSFKEFQSSAKNVNFRQNDFINAKSNFNEFIKNQDEIENIIDKYVQSTQFDENYDSINKNEKSIKANVLNFNKL